MTGLTETVAVTNPVDAITGQKREETKKPPKNYSAILRWLQASVAALFLIETFILLQPTLEKNLNQIATNVTGLSAMTLFMVSFTVAIILGTYTILSLMWTGGITVTLIWAKLRNKRHLFHKGEDRIYRLLIADKTETTWKAEGIGEIGIEGDAVGFLENGTPVMPSLSGFGRGINFKHVADNSILIQNPTIFEDRLASDKIKEVLKETVKRDNSIFLYVGICGLLLCIGGVYLYGQMQSGTCQTTLVQMAARCGESALELLNQTQTKQGTSAIPRLPTIGLP